MTSAANRGTDEGMWARDCWREAQVVQGSFDLLSALWKEHPCRMRAEFMYGRAKTPTMPVKRPQLFEVPTERQESEFIPPPVDLAPKTGMALIQAVADVFDISYGEVIGNGRSRKYVEARAIVIAVLRERGWSYPRIGKLMGGRDHSTVIHSHNTFDIHAKRSPIVAAMFNRLRPERVIERVL